MNDFCPKCGSEKGPFVKGFCLPCYLADHAIVSLDNEIMVEHCKQCRRIRVRGRWVEQAEEKISELVEKNLKIREVVEPRVTVSLDAEEDGSTLVRATVFGRLDGKPVVIAKETRLKPKTILCDACMKLSSDYHEAILQVRFSEKPSPKQLVEVKQFVEETLAAMRAKHDLAGIAGMEKVPKGIDFRIGSRKAGQEVAKALAKKHGSTITSSYTLVGRDESGRDKNRFTFCVRV